LSGGSSHAVMDSGYSILNHKNIS